MPRFLKSISLVFLAFIFVGCGKLVDSFRDEQNSGFTTVRIGRDASTQDLNAMATLTGGIMVYIVPDGSDASQGFFLANDDVVGAVTVPNGTYRFLAVGWTSGQMSVTPHCGLGADLAGGSPGDPVTLVGEDKSIIISMATSNCTVTDDSANPVFGDSAFMSGTNMLPIFVSFCGADVDVGTKSNSDNCLAESSKHFLRGSSTAVISDTDGSDDFDTLYYIVQNFYAGDSNDEHLFVTPLGFAGIPQRLTPKSPHGNMNVKEFEFSEDETMAFVLCDADTDEVFELYSVEVDDPSTWTKISGTMVSGGDVLHFDVVDTASMERVVYMADQTTDGVNELFSVNFDGTDLIDLTSTLTLSSGVPETTGGEVEGVFDITEDGLYVAFVAEVTGGPNFDVFSVETDDDTAITDLLTGTSIDSGTTARSIQIHRDDVSVYWVANNGSQAELWEFVVNSAGSELQCSTANGPADFFNLFDPDEHEIYPITATNEILFTKNIGGDRELFLTDNSDCTAHTQLSDLSGGSDFVTRMTWTPDATSVVYISDESGVRKIYSNNKGGNTPGTHDFFLMDTTSGTGVLSATSGREFAITPDSSKVVYIAQEDQAFNEVYSSDINTLGGSTLLHTALGGTEDVKDLGLLDNDQVVYVSDQGESDGDYVIFHTTISSQTATKIVNTPTGTAGVDEMAVLSSTEIFFTSDLNSSAEEGFLKDATQLNTGGVTRIAPTFDASGLGRFRLVALSFTADPVGNVFSQSGAIRTACLNPANEGEQTDTGAHFPVGTTADFRPFAVAIEYFPFATDCNGSSVPFVFNTGILQFDDTNFGSGIADVFTDSSTKNVIFISDPF